MKKMHKSLAGAIIGLVCANGAMAASCDVVSNRDPLAGALKFIGGGVGLGTGVLLSPFAGLVAGPLGITAVSVGGAYLGWKVGAKIYAKDDYICFDDKGKKCLQCDLHQIGDPYECNEGKVVVAPGIVKRCNTRLIGKDSWEDFKVPVCSGAVQLAGEKGSVVVDLKSILLKNLASQGVPGAFVTEDDVCYTYKCADGYNQQNGKCVKKGTTPPGPNPQDCEKAGGKLVNGQCQCPEGQLLDTRLQKCVKATECPNCQSNIFIFADNGSVVVIGDNSNVNSGGNHNTYNGGGGSSLQNCLNDPRRKDNQELLACCYVGSSGVNGANPDFTTGKCKCNAAGKTFSVADRKCIGGNGPVPPVNPHNCPANMYEASDGTCKCRASFQNPEKEKLKICECGIPDAYNDASGNCVCNDSKKTVSRDGKCVAKGVECDPATQIKEGETCKCIAKDAYNDNGICKCNNKDFVLKDNKCVMGESKIAEIRGRISTTFGSLNSKMGGFEKNVWKDAEGNFNTARLASDSIAGVVLGTAGGIITSKLVKKNQLKKGFEDIKCSIGGQNVASYGDSFTVGM